MVTAPQTADFANGPKSSLPPTPSMDNIAQQLGIDLRTEPELMHLVSEMQITPLPPTWTAVVVDVAKNTGDEEAPAALSSPQSTTPVEAAAAPGPRLEYVHRVTGERTTAHPGTPYFLAAVESERRGRNKLLWQGRGKDGLSTVGGSSISTVEDSLGGARSETLVSCNNNTGEVGIMRRDKTPQEVEKEGAVLCSAESSASEEEEGRTSTTTTRKRGSTAGEKRAKRRVPPPPKWLVFTSWWHETTSGTENSVHRKHASIRYSTADSSFEVELEGVPAIFDVSHANGRYGKVGTVDIRVGAKLSLLGRQMTLMQCDGLTAKWLESEVRAITRAKAALISALERGGNGVRVRCRSDRLEVSASTQRGSGSVGQAAEMDRRALLNDVASLRDILAQTRPDEAIKLTEKLTCL